MASEKMDCSGHSCCNKLKQRSRHNEPRNPSTSSVAPPAKPESLLGGCCRLVSDLTTTPTAPKMSTCSSNSCCVRKMPYKSITETLGSTPQNDRVLSDTSSCSSHSVVKIWTEDTTKAEHVTMSVQGMTCTGCEKNLYKSLASIAQVS